MAKLRVHNFSITLDGFAAGPNQRMDAPFGDRVDGLHDWLVATKSFNDSHEGEGGEEGIDDQFAAAAFTGMGATIMGRNMFGPQRGPWEDHSWQGWWGPNPPYHHDTFVMTHHLRPSLPMEGGTTFHFVNDSPKAVLEQAFKAANGKDVWLVGGAATIRQFLRDGLVDELHVVITPILAGSGERLFDNVGTLEGYQVTKLVSSEAATHALITRSTTP